MFPWLSFGLNNRDLQVWPIFLAIIFIFSVSDQIRVPRGFYTILLLIVFGVFFASAFTHNYHSYLVLRGVISYLSLPIFYLGFYNYLVKFGFPYRAFFSVNYSYLLMGIIELFKPEFSELFSSLRTTPGRGVTSFAPEPTFFATFLFIASWILLVLVREGVCRRHLLFLVALNFCGIIFLAKSLMISLLLVIAIVIWAVNWSSLRDRNRKSLFLLFGIFGAVFVGFLLGFFDFSDSRMYRAIVKLLSSESVISWITTDTSISARFGAVFYSVVGMFHNWLVPGGFDSYSEMRAQLLSSGMFPEFYDHTSSNVIMSWLGAAAYELGVFGIGTFLVVMAICCHNIRSLFSSGIILGALLVSGISAGFPLIPLLMCMLFFGERSRGHVGLMGRRWR